MVFTKAIATKKIFKIEIEKCLTWYKTRSKKRSVVIKRFVVTQNL